MANSFLWLWGGWRPIWGCLWRTFGRVFSTTPKPPVKQAPCVSPPPHLRHPLSGGTPLCARAWRGGGAVAGAPLAQGAQGRKDGRGCPRAVGNRWVSAAGTAPELLPAAERGAAVPQRPSGEERRLEHPLPLHVGGMVRVACCQTRILRGFRAILPFVSVV